MESTHIHALHERQDQSVTEVEGEYIRRLGGQNHNDDDDLPTTNTAQPAAQDDRRRGTLLPAGRVRRMASSLRGHAAAAGLAIASRSRQACLKLRGLFATLSPPASLPGLCRRRRRHRGATDLPIMRKPEWQQLAESHTDGTVAGSEGVGEEAGAKDDAREEGKVEYKAGNPGSGGGDR